MGGVIDYFTQYVDIALNNDEPWGTWVAQLVEHLTLDFGSGGDPRFVGSGPVLIMEPA